MKIWPKRPAPEPKKPVVPEFTAAPVAITSVPATAAIPTYTFTLTHDELTRLCSAMVCGFYSRSGGDDTYVDVINYFTRARDEGGKLLIPKPEVPL
jgi:hypothetical protein